MSDLTTNENQNENKYDLFKGVLLVDVGAVTQYSLIYMSELEIMVSSYNSYKEAEQSLKDVASYLGYNCVLNIVRDNYIDSMETSETMQTTGTINKGFLNSYNTKSKTTVNAETQVNNCFNIKGTLAIIGKPNPNGVSVDSDELSKADQIFLECLKASYPVRSINCELEAVIKNQEDFVLKVLSGLGLAGLLLVAFNLVTIVISGIIPAWLYILFIWSKSADKTRESYKNALAEHEGKFKNLASNYSNLLAAAYNTIPHARIKHIGD